MAADDGIIVHDLGHVLEAVQESLTMIADALAAHLIDGGIEIAANSIYTVDDLPCRHFEARLPKAKHPTAVLVEGTKVAVQQGFKLRAHFEIFDLAHPDSINAIVQSIRANYQSALAV